MTLDDLARLWPLLLAAVGGVAAVVTWQVRLEWKVSALDGIAPKVNDLVTKMTLIWDIYISDALKQQQTKGLLSHSSQFRLTPEFYKRYGKTVLPEISVTLRRMGRETLPKDDGELAIVIIQRLSEGVVKNRAMVFDMTVSEYLAVVVAWVREAEAHYHTKSGGLPVGT